MLTNHARPKFARRKSPESEIASARPRNPASACPLKLFSRSGGPFEPTCVRYDANIAPLRFPRHRPPLRYHYQCSDLRAAHVGDRRSVWKPGYQNSPAGLFAANHKAPLATAWHRPRRGPRGKHSDSPPLPESRHDLLCEAIRLRVIWTPRKSELHLITWKT
jgi:hypothetical protein